LTIFFLLFIIFITYYLTKLTPAINDILLNYLLSVDELPTEINFDAAYILGGDQKSLEAKYKTMASVYCQGRCKEIVILSRPGITEYNPNLGRNLTNDEWSLMIMNKYGISSQDVEMLRIESGFFGTYSEARSLAKIVSEKNWNRLLLITFPLHTKRVKKTFTYFISEKDLKMYVIASNHKSGFFELLMEFFKLQFYQIFLLS
jgi:hypothetical protein